MLKSLNNNTKKPWFDYKVTAEVTLPNLSFNPISDTEFQSDYIFEIGDYVLGDNDIIRIASLIRDVANTNTYTLTTDNIFGAEVILSDYYISESIELIPDENGFSSIIVTNDVEDIIRGFQFNTTGLDTKTITISYKNLDGTIEELLSFNENELIEIECTKLTFQTSDIDSISVNLKLIEVK